MCVGGLKMLKKSLALLLGVILGCNIVWAASPDIRIPKDNYTRIGDCSIWLCLPTGFTNGDCSHAMSSFVARQVRVAFKRLYTDLPLARFCFFDMYVNNRQSFNFESLLGLLIPKAMANDVVVDDDGNKTQVPADVNYSESEYGKFGGDDHNDPDLGHSFTTKPIAIVDRQIVCAEGAAYREHNSNGTYGRWKCSRTTIVGYNEYDGEQCLKTGEMIYGSGVLIDSGTRTAKSGKKFCNRVENETCVFVRGQLQGNCYKYNAINFYEPMVP